MHRTVRKVLLAAFASTLLLASTNRIDARTTSGAMDRIDARHAAHGVRGAGGVMPQTLAGVPRSPQLAKGLERWFRIGASNDPSLRAGQLIRFADAGEGRIVAIVYEDLATPDKDNPWNLAELSEVGGLPMISGYVGLPGGAPKSHEHSVLIWFTHDSEAPASLRVDAVFVHPPSGHPDHAQQYDRIAIDDAGRALARVLAARGDPTPAATRARANALSGLVGMLWHNGTWHGSGD